MASERPAGQRASRDLSPGSVSRRLDELRRSSVVERDEEARARLARERPSRREPFEVAVARRLRDLRELCALADYLHRRERRAAVDRREP